MKLRIHGNSVRLRLGPGDVERLMTAGRVQQHVAFGPEPAHRLWYTLEVAANEPAVRAVFDCTSLRILLPDAVARRWATTDQVGVDAEQDVGGGVTGETLAIRIEKDFACLHPGAGRAGEDADTYPHPGAGGGGGMVE